MADETNDTNETKDETPTSPETPESAGTPEAAGTPESAAPEAATPEGTSAEAVAPEGASVEGSADAAASGEASSDEAEAAPSAPAKRPPAKPRSSARSASYAGSPNSGAPAGSATHDIEETVVKVYRCAAVVKGGRRFSFAALVVAGDRNGKVGIGYGKANEVPNAVEKATKAARRDMTRIRLSGTTIPHQTRGRFGASNVELIPAVQGTGVIAGASVRAVLELAGVKDVLTKCHGSTSPKNLVKAAYDGLLTLRTKEDVEKLREVSLA